MSTQRAGGHEARRGRFVQEDRHDSCRMPGKRAHYPHLQAGWVPIVLLTLLLAPIPAATGSAEEAPVEPRNEQRIELLIINYDFVPTHPLPIRFGIPTVIILRNQDIVAHGFQSSALSRLKVRAHGEGLAVYGTGIEGFHIDPGKTLAIHFVPERNSHLTFHCDLHPQMKGELFLLEIPAA